MSTSKPFDAEREIAHLRELISQRLDHRDIRVAAEAAALAIRLEGMNLFRDQLREQAASFITRTEIQLMGHTRDEAIQRLERRTANLEGRLWAFGAIVALAVTALGAIPGLFWK